MKQEKKRKYQPSQAEQAIELLMNRKHELFHDPSGRPYYALDAGGRVTTYDIESDRLKQYVTALYFERFAVPIKDADRKRAIDTLAAQATQKSPCYQMFLRTAWHEGRIYVDLANDGGQVIEITAEGWSLTTSPPIRFYRSDMMAALPIPVVGGSLDLLRKYINVTESDWPIVGGWLLDAAKGRGPYHVLVINGAQNSAKSTTEEFVCSVLDPLSFCQICAMPEQLREIAIFARNHHVLGFDNLSYISHSQSDALCRLATGAGFAVRRLYTNDGMFAVDGARPVVLNGITDFVELPDLLDRCLIVECPQLTEGRKLWELKEGFTFDHPKILGALCTVLSAAMTADSPKENKARMQDSYDWMYRCSEAAGWGCETFMDIYAEKRELTGEIAVEGCMIADVLEEFLGKQKGNSWFGTVKELHGDLTSYLLEKGSWNIVNSPSFPKTPKKLGSELRRHEPSLRRLGIKQRREPKGRQGRPIAVWIEPEKQVAEPMPSKPTAPAPTIQEDDWIDSLDERIAAALRR